MSVVTSTTTILTFLQVIIYNLIKSTVSEKLVVLKVPDIQLQLAFIHTSTDHCDLITVK